jgi:hypothetical protein
MELNQIPIYPLRLVQSYLCSEASDSVNNELHSVNYEFYVHLNEHKRSLALCLSWRGNPDLLVQSP